MKIPIVSAATSQTDKVAGSAAMVGAKDAKEAKDAKTSFSSVLDSQQAPQAVLVPAGHKPAGKPSQAKDDAPAKSDEEVLSLLVAGQGLIQQPLALNAAAQAGSAAEMHESHLRSQAALASPGGSVRGANTDHVMPDTGPANTPPSSEISPDAIARVIQEQLAATNTPSGPSSRPAAGRDSKPGDPVNDKLKSHTAIPLPGTAGATIAAAGQQAALASHPFSNSPPADPKPLHLAQDAAQTSTLAVVNINSPGAQGTPGAGSGTAATVSPAVLRIDTPLQNPQWASDFGRQFVSLTSNHAQSQTAELHINPPNLGPLHISINISDNVAHAIFMSPHAAVRGAVENALPQLQQALAQNGISLGQANVSDQRPSAGSFHEPTGQKRRGAVGAIAGAATEQGVVGQARTRSVSPDSLVDTFA
ncbi:flagellar hook-length control protein FliK [Paralcaligenes sp. KSB-10]|uniref:flagellar hook-length control protein FliK n=1 Tax=Paralcaligenes sp. KSB-10 TaxID=2901142 RepID=UPI001E4FE615|nr:flagellar hook-length control protein FliK [Paralcaligenes sp. KSB-10]UHL65297.1 flagellar hook-length control protein FliK [Paralcaligenes sp. KSB-10]